MVSAFNTFSISSFKVVFVVGFWKTLFVTVLKFYSISIYTKLVIRKSDVLSCVLVVQ